MYNSGLSSNFLRNEIKFLISNEFVEISKLFNEKFFLKNELNKIDVLTF